MDFKEALSEDVSVEFQELSETGGNELLFSLQTSPGKTEDTFRIYDEDIVKLKDFLNKLYGFGVIK
jgi:hypothetical protein